jgi:hypothetical protein
MVTILHQGENLIKSNLKPEYAALEVYLGLTLLIIFNPYSNETKYASKYRNSK